jgi:hypothetical protein
MRISKERREVGVPDALRNGRVMKIKVRLMFAGDIIRSVWWVFLNCERTVG